MNNEKSPEQIRQESDHAREVEEKAAIARGALPDEQPTRIIHGHPAALSVAEQQVEALPPATEVPPTIVDGDQPGDIGTDALGDYSVGEDGVRRYHNVTGDGSTVIVNHDPDTFEVINGKQDRAPIEGPATFVALGRNSEGSYGELSSDFPFTDETTEGRVLRNDGAIVMADGTRDPIPDTEAAGAVFAPPLTGVVDAAPTVLVAEPGAPDIQSIADGVEPSDRVVTYREALPADEQPKVADPEAASVGSTDHPSYAERTIGDNAADAGVATDSSGSYGDVAGQSFEEAQVFEANPADADTTAEAEAEDAETKPGTDA